MTPDSFNSLTVTVTPQSVLWKYTFEPYVHRSQYFEPILQLFEPANIMKAQPTLVAYTSIVVDKDLDILAPLDMSALTFKGGFVHMN